MATFLQCHQCSARWWDSIHCSCTNIRTLVQFCILLCVWLHLSTQNVSFRTHMAIAWTRKVHSGLSFFFSLLWLYSAAQFDLSASEEPQEETQERFSPFVHRAGWTVRPRARTGAELPPAAAGLEMRERRSPWRWMTEKCNKQDGAKGWGKEKSCTNHSVVSAGLQRALHSAACQWASGP